MVGKAHFSPTPRSARSELALHIMLCLGMAALLVCSLLYWKLRGAFSDTPIYIMNIVRNDGFAIAHNRFVGALSQWLPVLLVKFGAPLKAIVVAYSFCYSLMPVLLALLALFWLRQPFTALAILLQFTLMNALLFYYPVSEFQAGLGLLLLYDGIAEHCESGTRRSRTIFTISTLLLVPTIAFSHPFAMPVFACWLVYRIINKHPRRAQLALAIFCFAAAWLLKKAFFETTYEALKELGWKQIRPFGLNYYYGPLGQSFFRYVIADAFLVPIVLVLTCALLAFQKKWRLLLSALAFMLALYTLVMIAFEDFGGAHTYDHYYEHFLQAPIAFLLLALRDALRDARLDGKIVAGALGLVFILSFAKISNRSEWHERRQRWQYKLLAQMDELHLKKAIIGRKWCPEGMWMGSFWSSSAETLILSAMQGPEKSKTLYMAWNVDEVHEPYQSSDQIITDGDAWPQESFPARYFRLGHKPYVFLENILPDSTLQSFRWP